MQVRVMASNSLAHSINKRRDRHVDDSEDGSGYFDDPLYLLTSLELFHKQLYSVTPKITRQGQFGKNRRSFVSVGYQVPALDCIIDGLVNNRPSSIEMGLHALKYSFKFQNSDGSFQSNTGSVKIAPQLHAVTHFLVTAVTSYLLLQQTPYRFKYMKPLADIRQGIKMGISWMYRHHHYQYKQDSVHSKYMVYDAILYDMCSELFRSRQLKKTARLFLKSVLAKQRSDGVFVECGGHDSSSQATTLLLLHHYLIFVKQPACVNQILKSMVYGTEWLKTRVLKTGEVSSMGNVKSGRVISRLNQRKIDINYLHVMKAFLFYSHITGDKESRTLTRRIYQYLKRDSK